MKKMQTKYSKDECNAFENFMVEIGQWKRENGSIVQSGVFKTQEEIERLWKDRINRIKQAEKERAKPKKMQTVYRKKIS